VSFPVWRSCRCRVPVPSEEVQLAPPIGAQLQSTCPTSARHRRGPFSAFGRFGRGEGPVRGGVVPEPGEAFAIPRHWILIEGTPTAPFHPPATATP